jgi:CelD/BcsL family acetyltransferase involved in cellulose biosynthesis
VVPLYGHGRKLAAMANEHSPVYGPLGDSDAVRVAIDAVVARAPVELAMTALADGHELFAEASKAAGRLTVLQDVRCSPVIDTRGSFADYRSTLDRKARKDLDRRSRRLAEAGGAIRLDLPDDLDSKLDDAFAIEASGWKGDRGTAILSSAAAERFYRTVAHSFGAERRLLLPRVELDGRMIAFDLTLDDGGRLWPVKGSFDGGHGVYAPGLLLTMAEIEHCFERGLEGFELLGDRVSWKLFFANAERPIRSVHSYGRRGAARYLHRRLIRPALHRAYRRVLPWRARG